jgi:ABC-2 type transport system permease protein
MNKTLHLIKREFKTKLFTKGFLISTILGPIFIIGIIFMPLLFEDYSENEPMVIQVVDQTGILAGELRENFSDTLDNGRPRYIISPVPNSVYETGKEEFYQAIEDNYVDLLMIIPGNVFDRGVITFTSASLSNQDFIRLAQQRVNAIVNKLRLQHAGFDPGEIERLTRRIEFKTVKISKGKETEKRFGEEWPTAFTFLMILYVTIVIYGAAVMRGVLEEKTSRILEILLSSSNSFQLMMGKLLGIGSVGLTQYLIWVTVALSALAVVGASAPTILNYVSVSPAIFTYFILFFIIGYFQFSTLYAAVGAMCSTQEDAQAMSAPVTLLVVIPFIITISLGGSDPSSSLSRLLSLLPFFAPMLMFLRIQLSDPAMWEIVTAVLINVLSIVFFTWLSARIYRVGVLIYGKRPTMPEILRWLRYR